MLEALEIKSNKMSKITVKKLCKEFDITNCKFEFKLLKDKYLSIKSEAEILKITTAENNAKELKKMVKKQKGKDDDDDDEDGGDENDCGADVDETTPTLVK